MTTIPSNSWAIVTAVLTATEKQVWQLLTDPLLTERYMYNCQLHAIWEVGQKAVWKAKNADGSLNDHVVAEVLFYQPYSHLAFTIFHQATETHSATQSELHYLLEQEGDGIRLTIKQGDFETIADGASLRAQCQKGWESVMPQLIKTCNATFRNETQ